jgi:putative aminopeptidase FrvX
MELLKTLCSIPGTSGDEGAIRDFVFDYVISHQRNWKYLPEIWKGDGFQDNLVLVFGKPKIAFYAHMDTVGYTIRYDNYVIPIGGIDGNTGDALVFEKEGKLLETKLINEEKSELSLIDAHLPVIPGTPLSYKANFIQEDDLIKSPYLDDRLGVWALLQLAPTANNIALVFTTYEEHGGGAAGYLARLLFEKYGTCKAIIADVTWTSKGVQLGKGSVVSLRDSRIPRRAFVNELRKIFKMAGIPFQLEVEFYGGSDGKEIQNLPYPIDWCFIGPPSDNPHSSLETVHKEDVTGFVQMLKQIGEHYSQS